jgi:beta-galactosidase
MSLPVPPRAPKISFGGDYNPEQWDEQEALEVGSRLVFELVQPQGAEVVGTYQDDFYAGTAAVTRHPFGAGCGWYVGAGLDQPGVSWVIRRVLAEQNLPGRYPGAPDVETAARVAADGTRLLFLLNHRAEPVTVLAAADGVDLLTGHPDRVWAAGPARAAGDCRTARGTVT